MKIFIVPGYHLSKNMSVDKTYIKYFNFVCKTIVDEAAKNERITVILSGGNIDMDKPFTRILSVEMCKPFLQIADKYSLNMDLQTEEESASTLENYILSKRIVDKIHGSKDIYIFSDSQRSKRSRILADKIFNNYKLIKIDLAHKKELKNKDVVDKKEELAIKFSLWALESEQNMNFSQKTYAEKFKYLRSFAEEDRKDAEIKWWKKKIEEFQNLKDK